MKRNLMIIAACAALAIAVSAQTPVQHSEFSVQYSGVFTHNFSNNPTRHLATNSGGILAGYRFQINNWEGLEVQYGFTRNGQKYITPATAAGSPAVNNYITADMNQFIANEVLSTPRLGPFKPFVVVGGGVLDFIPRRQAGLVLTHQLRGTFNYGAGLDLIIDHIGVRVEFQGLVFKIPDFGDSALATNKWTHVAQPSAGLVLTF